MLAIPFGPFALMPSPAARLAFTALGLAMMAWYVRAIILLGGTSAPNRRLLLGMVIVNGPLVYSLKEGNTTHCVLALLLLAFLAVKVNRYWAAGTIIGIAGLIKLPLLLFGPYFLARRQWKALAGFSVTIVVLVLLSFILFGLDLHVVWFETNIRPFMSGRHAAFNAQSIDGVLARWWYDRGLLNWQLISVSTSYMLVRYSLVAGLIGAAAWVCARSTPGKHEVVWLEYSIVLTLAVLISPAASSGRRNKSAKHF